ncbi:hypothetical protein ANN_10875 [Periplaneta americana]|uniref:Uncharacterized protein n=1 Tax=Periplaneta americana TaxID=6978 RepID=A0ABQ8T3G1_PERAM|nr:hypothetical protein ANN_10875 [Periplaneta americana]
MSPSIESYQAILLRVIEEKSQPSNLSQPGFEPGSARFTAKNGNRYSTAVERPAGRAVETRWLLLPRMSSSLNFKPNALRKEGKCFLFMSRLLLISTRSINLLYSEEASDAREKLTYAYRVLVGRPEEIRPLGRPRRRWEDNIKMDLREVGYDDRDWINLAQDRDQWRAYDRRHLNNIFPDRWIGRGGPVPWPSRSPDLNPLDFYLWGHLKACVYAEPIPDVQTLEQHIRAACDAIWMQPGIFERYTSYLRTLAEKKLLAEGCTGRNGEREKSSGQKKISDDRRH